MTSCILEDRQEYQNTKPLTNAGNTEASIFIHDIVPTPQCTWCHISNTPQDESSQP
jgi:hypothetical protein